jgi:hypothetical protein
VQEKKDTRERNRC